MARIAIQHDTDPGIAIVLTASDRQPMVPGLHGACTECGWPMHRWHQEEAIRAAQEHVDRHESSL